MASAETLADNVDVITEILIRLPAKTLIKFKCVSKQWLSLISEPLFYRAHTLRHHSPHSVPSALLINNGYTPLPHFQTVPLRPFEADPSASELKVPDFDYLGAPYVKILQSCNGLLLCSTSNTRMKMGNPSMRYFSCSTSPPMSLGWVIHDDSESTSRYFVCNPTTRQSVALPFPRQMFKNYYNKVIFNLAFDPLRSQYFQAISISQRKVFRPDVLGIEVYSSENGFWVDSGISLIYKIGMGILSGVFHKGSILWYCDGKNGDGLHFDVDRQRLKTMPMPRPFSSLMKTIYFGESRGHLHLMRTREPMHLKFDVWGMEEDYSGWSIKHYINLYTVRRALPTISWKSKNDYETLYGPYSVLGMISGENEDDSNIILLVDHKVVCYNPKHQTSRKIRDLEPCSSFPRFGKLDYYDIQAFQYVETLACL